MQTQLSKPNSSFISSLVSDQPENGSENTLALLSRAKAFPKSEHPVSVYLASLAEGSRRTMRGALDTIARELSRGECDAMTFPWQQLRFQHTQAIRTLLEEKYAPATANKSLSAMRGVLKAAWKLRHMETDEYSRAVDIGAIRGETLPRGRAISGGELHALFRSCADGTKLGARDAALLAVLYGMGMRRGESVGLDLSDYDPQTGALTIRNGKGNKQRMAYAKNGAFDALEAWLQVRGNESGPLFLPVFRGGHVAVRRLTTQAVLYILLQRAQSAGIRNISPHDFRRTFVSDLLDKGVDIVTVQKLAGHANVATTGRYDRRGEEAKKKAVEMLHVPFVG